MAIDDRDIKILQLEPTDVCQAACPACSRETDIGFDKTQKNHLTIDQISRYFDNQKIKNLDKMYMCGLYGDPAAGKHTLDIYQYFRQVNPKITLGMNTNGALQNTKWWQQIGRLFNHTEDYVVFSIDGLSDTNHVYRVGVNWQKLMDNVKAFIQAGGRAHWDMLVWRHNEHQVEQCETLAKNLGFYWFRVKVSMRPLPTGFQSPVSWQRPAIRSAEIACRALRDRAAYIDARGRLFACCDLAQDTRVPTDFIAIQKSWQTSDPHSVCVKVCGQQHQTSNFSGQWQKQVELRQ